MANINLNTNLTNIKGYLTTTDGNQVIDGFSGNCSLRELIEDCKNNYFEVRSDIDRMSFFCEVEETEYLITIYCDGYEIGEY